MFAKLVRINQNGKEMEIVLDTNEIAFVTESEPHINYDKVTGYEEITNEETGVITKVPNQWEEEKRFVVAFKNGKHPQFLDQANYEKLVEILLK